MPGRVSKIKNVERFDTVIVRTYTFPFCKNRMIHTKGGVGTGVPDVSLACVVGKAILTILRNTMSVHERAGVASSDGTDPIFAIP